MNHFPTYAAVGSREAPADICKIIYRLGKILCDKGWHGMSGEAPGCDYFFHAGAKTSKHYKHVGFTAIIPWQGFESQGGLRVYARPGNNIITLAQTGWERRAYWIGIGARGTDAGLGRGGIALHSRNALQVLGENMQTKVRMLICYAKPVGKTGKVKGGTNTAVVLAIHYKIPIINLAIPEGLTRALKMIHDHESKEANCKPTP